MNDNGVLLRGLIITRNLCIRTLRIIFIQQFLTTERVIGVEVLISHPAKPHWNVPIQVNLQFVMMDDALPLPVFNCV
jgi:hypothetical protein